MFMPGMSYVGLQQETQRYLLCLGITLSMLFVVGMHAYCMVAYDMHQ